MLHPKYRPDIDGLRAVAVGLVVIFHAFPELLKGGFVGVDVFFIISGYLISTILYSNLKNNTFSFFDFYSRRIIRIFPSLITVLVFCFVMGYVSLFPDEMSTLGKHMYSGAAFISNIVLWSESGYFDTAAHTKPLLHLWSLGVEEQFYILWPLVLFICWRGRIHLGIVTGIVLLISFLANVGHFHSDPSATYYSPLTRFWEILLGSFLAWGGMSSTWLNSNLFQKGKFLNVLSLIGFSFIIFGAFYISKEDYYPGWVALLPTLGGVAIIAAGPSAIINKKILSNRVFVFIGLISFPLYLWHWPLLSFARILVGDTPAWTIRVFMVLLAIFFAWLTYKFIETPIRFGRFTKIKVPALTATMIAVASVAAATQYYGGFSDRDVVKANASLDSGFDGGDIGFTINGCGISNESDVSLVALCVHDKRGGVKYALLGDSKAAALYHGLIRTSTDEGRWLFIGGNGKNGAPVPVISNKNIYQSFQQVTKTAVDAISKNKDVEVVVYVTAARALFQLANDYSIDDMESSPNYESAFEGLSKSISVFKQAGKKVVLVVDNPTLAHQEDCINRKTSIEVINNVFSKNNLKCSITLDEHMQLARKYFLLLDAIKEKYPNDVFVFNSLPYLCNDSGVCSHRKNGRFMYSYTDHISDYAASEVGRALNKYLLTL
ncbi:acyltransferase family protein [Aeromonas veronii]|uniref:acyltransferase family protein n=1 Tax=Aeromonas veronii TaxID=654 RepID=UPI003B9FC1C5